MSPIRDMDEPNQVMRDGFAELGQVTTDLHVGMPAKAKQVQISAGWFCSSRGGFWEGCNPSLHKFGRSGCAVLSAIYSLCCLCIVFFVFPDSGTLVARCGNSDCPFGALSEPENARFSNSLDVRFSHFLDFRSVYRKPYGVLTSVT